MLSFPVNKTNGSKRHAASICKKRFGMTMKSDARAVLATPPALVSTRSRAIALVVVHQASVYGAGCVWGTRGGANKGINCTSTSHTARSKSPSQAWNINKEHHTFFHPLQSMNSQVAGCFGCADLLCKTRSCHRQLHGHPGPSTNVPPKVKMPGGGCGSPCFPWRLSFQSWPMRRVSNGSWPIMAKGWRLATAIHSLSDSASHFLSLCRFTLSQTRLSSLVELSETCVILLANLCQLQFWPVWHPQKSSFILIVDVDVCR